MMAVIVLNPALELFILVVILFVIIPNGGTILEWLARLRRRRKE